jgi:hypothetical protein
MSSGENSLNVVKIGKAAPDDQVIEQAEFILEQAKAGNMRSLLWVSENLDGTYTHGITRRTDSFKCLAYLDRLRHRVNLWLDADSHDPIDWVDEGDSED